MMRSRKWLLICVVTGLVFLLLGGGLGWLGYQKFQTPKDILSARAEVTASMADKVIYYDNGKQIVIDMESEVGREITKLLTVTLHRINSICNCLWNEEQIQEMRENNRCIELAFGSPINVAIDRWIEPEDRHRIETNEKGYNILEKTYNTLFIIEDNQGEGLYGHTLVGRESEEEITYTGWSISVGRDKEDRSWVPRLEELIERLP